MSKIAAVPSHLVPIGMLQTEPVQVTRGPELDTDKEGKEKISDHFPGLSPYRVRVEFFRGQAKKTLRDGKEISYPVYEEINVKVWCETRPAVAVGDYVLFQHVMVGVISETATPYFQALGVSAVKREGDK